MKTLWLIPLLCSLALGQIGGKAGVGGKAGIGQGAAAPPTYLFHETFEGSTLCFTAFSSNCDNAWFFASGANVVFNYTTAPAPLQGTKSMASTGTSFQTNSTAFTLEDNVYAATEYAVTVFASGSTVPALEIISSDGSTSLCKAGIFDHTNFGVFNQAGTSTFIAKAFLVSTLYYLKLQYIKGTGANSVCNAWYSTDGSTWTEASVTGGASTTQAKYLLFTSTNNADVQVWDDIRVSTSDINYP